MLDDEAHAAVGMAATKASKLIAGNSAGRDDINYETRSRAGRRDRSAGRVRRCTVRFLSLSSRMVSPPGNQGARRS